MQDPIQQGYLILYENKNEANKKFKQPVEENWKKQRSIYDHRYKLPKIKSYEMDSPMSK